MNVRLARTFFVLALAGLGFIGGWIAHLTPASLAQHDQVTLSQVYTDALASGQAYLKLEPDAALKASPDPWTPAMAGHHVGDASYFEGHYYIYFGIVPFFFLLVPWFKLTGAFLSDGAGIWFFCGLGFIAYGSALFRIWRQWFREVPAWAFALALLTLGVASGAGSLLASQNIYELVSSSGYACFAVAVAALVAAETSARGGVSGPPSPASPLLSPWVAGPIMPRPSRSSSAGSSCASGSRQPPPGGPRRPHFRGAGPPSSGRRPPRRLELPSFPSPG